MGYPRWRRFILFDCQCGSLSFFTKLIMCVGLPAGRPVERYRLHGTFSGLHFWLGKVRHAAWSGQGPSRTWPALRHDPGTQEIIFAFIYVCVCVSVVSDVAHLCDGCVSTCRIQVSAAHSPRAHTGRSMKGWGETFLSKTLKEKHSLGRWDNWSCDDYIKAVNRKH